MSEKQLSEHAAALISRLVDINFEFIKGTGHWPSLKEITPPNLELIRDCGRQAEKHAEALIAEWEQVVQQRDDLLAALKELVKANEDWNAAVQKVVVTPPGWTDGYLDRARAAIAKAEGSES